MKTKTYKNGLMGALLLSSPFLLSGCVGLFLWEGETVFHEDFPDIRTVPTREKAKASHPIYKGKEKEYHSNEFKHLKQAHKKITARDQALRQKAFQE